MILKKIFTPFAVARYMQRELLAATLLSGAVYFLYHGRHLAQVGLPFSVAAILGSALAIFIAFRNNSSYARWWEARTLWGGIVNPSRVLARLVVTFADSHAHQPNYNPARSERFKTEMVHKVIAWVHALRLHLRGQTDWHTLRPFLSEAEYAQLLGVQHKPNFIHLITGKQIYAAMADGTLGGFDSFQMEGQLLALANYQGGCERIKHTPLLRQYHFFTQLFLLVFMAVLPFSLVGEFHRMGAPWLMAPVSILVSFVFGVMGKVGEVNEDPFENRITDVPLSAQCNTIERDLREMLGETDLPPKLEAQDGYLF